MKLIKPVNNPMDNLRNLEPSSLLILMNTLDQYLRLNQERFNEKEKKALKGQFKSFFIVNTTNAIPDELYDFLVYAELADISRAEYFGKYIIQKYPVDEFPNILDVGAGRMCRLSQYLLGKGYSVTAMDPNIRLRAGEVPGLRIVKKRFVCDEQTRGNRGTDISPFSAVVALEPCEAAEAIIRKCGGRKPFEVLLCSEAHSALNGRKFSTCDEWYDYLGSINRNVYIEKIPGGHVVARGEIQRTQDIEK